MSLPSTGLPRNTRGKTVGRALLKSFVHDSLYGKQPGHRPLYTQAQFNRMIAGLRSDYEHGIYLRYVSLHNGLVEELVRAQGYYQQAEHGLTRLQYMLQDARRCEIAESLTDVLLLSLREKLAAYGEADPPQIAETLSRMRSLNVGLLQLWEDPTLRAEITFAYETLLFPALRGLLAFNALIDILKNSLGLADIGLLRFQMTSISYAFSIYNADIQTFPALFKRSDGMKKRALLPVVFPQVDMTTCDPSFDAIALVTQNLSDSEQYRDGILQGMILLLMEGVHGC